MTGEIVVDNFAGGGGASTGIERALGRPIDIAVNHDADAIRMHQVNHPFTKHLREDVWKVNPMVECAGRPVGLAWFSPDCFPAGTLVLTRRGYQAIEEIEVGDEVLTHKLRWGRVTEVSHTRKPLMSIKGHGHPGLLVSPEHPFYVRHRKSVWCTEPRGYGRVLGDAGWAPASLLTKGWYWATPTTFPASTIPPVLGRGMVADNRFMWLVGRYLGDGWTRLTDTRAELVLTCGKHEVEKLRQTINTWMREGERAGFNELAWHERETGTAYQFSTNHRGLVEWLREHFGHRAESKRIPAWALGIGPAFKQSLLDGYLSADGWAGKQFTECRTVSKHLAFGIKALLNSLGKTVTVHLLQNSNEIQGRIVNARPIYLLRWRENIVDGHSQTIAESGLEWCPIRSQEPAVVETDVFNIGVEDDESYIVEGIVVHNCKHFSKAKGTKPVSKKIRGLAWVVLRWAATVKPRVIMLENVEEFITWGPLITKTDGKQYPCPKRKGRTFRSFLNALRKNGYEVDHKMLRACDYGDPTIRKRLFLIARSDGQPIVWPEPTHGDPKSAAVKSGKLLPWRTAAECIQWDIPAPSIFERKKPLAEATQRRIAMGIKRYVTDSTEPFIVTYYGDKGGEFRGQSVGDPLATQTTENRHGLVVPYITEHANGSSPRSMPIDEPLRTICAETKGGHFALVAPHIIGVGGRAGQSRPRHIEEPVATVTAKADSALVMPHLIPLTHQGGDRTNDIKDPFPTITAAHRGELALVSPVLSSLYSSKGDEDRCHPVDDPLPTITATQRHALVSAFLAKHYGGVVGSQVEMPLGTVTSVDHHSLVAASLVRYMGSSIGYAADEPVRTVTQRDKDSLVTSHLVKLKGTNIGQDSREPLQTITAGGLHFGEVRAFLLQYHAASESHDIRKPINTISTRDRFGLVKVHGEDYQIIDIGLRMLAPREIFRAQGFYDTYIIEHDMHGKPFTKTAQVRLCGNSVCPGIAAALVKANYANHAVYAHA